MSITSLAVGRVVHVLSNESSSAITIWQPILCSLLTTPAPMCPEEKTFLPLYNTGVGILDHNYQFWIIINILMKSRHTKKIKSRACLLFGLCETNLHMQINFKNQMNTLPSLSSDCSLFVFYLFSSRQLKHVLFIKCLPLLKCSCRVCYTHISI